MLFEFCAENLTHIEAALKAGARRVELCDNLAVGGTTPSAGVIARAVRLVHAHEGAAVRAIIRPRGGDFVFDEAEFAAMEADIRCAVEQGVDGVVIGCVLPKDEGAYAPARAAAIRAHVAPGDAPAGGEDAAYSGGYRLDEEGTRRLVAAARQAAKKRGASVGITFHMAFDALDPADQPAAIDVLAALGVDRILTHGGAAGTPIMGNVDRLRALIEHAGSRLTILPGAGITFRNAADVARALGVHELHGTKIVDLA